MVIPPFAVSQCAPQSVDRWNPETSPPARRTPDPEGSTATTFSNPPPSKPDPWKRRVPAEGGSDDADWEGVGEDDGGGCTSWWRVSRTIRRDATRTTPANAAVTVVARRP